MKNSDSDISKIVRNKIAEIHPLLRYIENADLSKYTIAIFQETLEDAIQYFLPQLSQNKTLELLILDSDTSDQLVHAKVDKEYNGKVTLIAKDNSVCNDTLCAYVNNDILTNYKRINLLYSKNIKFISGNVHLYFYFGQVTPDPEFFESRFSDICTVYAALSDDESRETFLRVLVARAKGDLSYVRMSGYPQYRHPLVNAVANDTVMEGGVCDGYTTCAFAKQVGNQGHVYGFEPVREYALNCQKLFMEDSRITVEPCGLWSAHDSFYIEPLRGRSHISANQTSASEQCHVVALDEYVAEKNITACDLIKLDVEGAEVATLQGASNILQRHKPKLQISLYHKREHYLDIPLRLMQEGYKQLYIGHHTLRLGETILYATTQTVHATKHSIANSQKVLAEEYLKLQNEADIQARQLAIKLADAPVLFWGAGAAYHHYKNWFAQCCPQAILLDAEFMLTKNKSHIDGIPLLTPEELPTKHKKLPVIVFVRSEHTPFILEKVRMFFGPKNMSNIHIYQLYLDVHEQA